MLDASVKTVLEGFDFYRFDDQLSEKHRNLRDRVRAWVNEVVLPDINSYWDRAEFPQALAMRLKELPIIGGNIAEHGGAGLDFMEMGLVMYELAKGDGSMKDVTEILERKYGSLGEDHRNTWFGHPDRVALTVEGEGVGET